MSNETESIQDVAEKKAWEKAVKDTKAPFNRLANIWIKSNWDKPDGNYFNYLTDLSTINTSKEEKSFKTFHWEIEFPEVWYEPSGQRKDIGGFDAICQNPPWGASYHQKTRTFLNKVFHDIIVRIPNSYIYFVGQASRLVKPGGSLGVVIPDTILAQPETEALRYHFKEMYTLNKVVNLGGGVFVQPDGSQPTAPSCIICLSKSQTKGKLDVLNLSPYAKEEKSSALKSATPEKIENSKYFDLPGLKFLATNDLENKLNLFRKMYFPERVYFREIREDLSQGVTTGGDYAFVVNSSKIEYLFLDSTHVKKTLTGSYIKPYTILDSPLRIIYANAEFDPSRNLEIMNHLDQFKSRLSNKSETKAGIRPWYRLHRQRDEKKLTSEKILIRQTGDRLIAAIDKEGIYILDSIYFITIKEEYLADYPLELIEAVLNSTAWNFLYVLLTQETGRVFSQVKAGNIDCLPLPHQSRLEAILNCLGRKEKGWQDKVDLQVSLAFDLNHDDHDLMKRLISKNKSL
jgi:hypothetical protein